MSTPVTSPHPPARRRLKVGHLVSGIVLLGLALLWLLDAAGLMIGISWTYLVPLLLIGAGVLGLVASIVGGVRNRRAEAEARRAAEDASPAEAMTHARSTTSVEEEPPVRTSILPVAESDRDGSEETDPRTQTSDIDMTAPLRREENR